MSANRFTLGLVLCVTTTLLSAGCASSDTGRERSKKAMGSLTDTRDALNDARKSVDETVASIDSLQNTEGDLRPAWGKFKDRVNDSKDHAKKIGDRAADLRANAAAYQARWQEEIATVDNPDLKRAAEMRSKRVAQRYSQITQRTVDARAAYEPFLKDLKDVQTFLSNDLTPDAVRLGRPGMDKARSSARTLSQKIDAAIAEIDNGRAELSPKTAE
jgi:hypothetical protein